MATFQNSKQMIDFLREQGNYEEPTTDFSAMSFTGCTDIQNNSGQLDKRPDAVPLEILVGSVHNIEKYVDKELQSVEDVNKRHQTPLGLMLDLSIHKVTGKSLETHQSMGGEKIGIFQGHGLDGKFQGADGQYLSAEKIEKYQKDNNVMLVLFLCCYGESNWNFPTLTFSSGLQCRYSEMVSIHLTHFLCKYINKDDRLRQMYSGFMQRFDSKLPTTYEEIVDIFEKQGRYIEARGVLLGIAFLEYLLDMSGVSITRCHNGKEWALQAKPFPCCGILPKNVFRLSFRVKEDQEMTIYSVRLDQECKTLQSQSTKRRRKG